MNTFTIDGTEFGINLSESNFELNQALLSLEIHGDEQVFTALMDNEDSEWSWALYPPYLYIRSLETKAGKAALNGDEDFDVALYMMEHNTILEACVSLTSGCGVEISGLVDLMGEEKSFHVRFTQNGA